MKKLFYISLDRSVVKKQLGGYSHIKGVIDGVKNYYKLKVGAWCTNLLDVNDNSVTYIDIHHKAYYFQVFKILLSDKNTDVFLFRKNLIGMYVVSIAFLVKRLLGSKQKYFFEFNAISGDYQVDSKIKSIILYWSNIIPVILCDGVYCVTQSVFDRLDKNSLVASNKLILCQNGGPTPLFQEPSNISGEKVCIYYYGSDMPYYHINHLIKSIKNIRNKLKKPVELHLVGPNMDHFSCSVAKCHGAMGLSEFNNLMKNTKGMAWGIVPLDKFDAGSSIDPIKTFDYLSLGMPVIHSNECLSSFDNDKLYSEKYDIDNIERTLLKISDWCVEDYLVRYESVLSNYHYYQWESRLESLRELMDTE